jgi:hypothetical protein
MQGKEGGAIFADMHLFVPSWVILFASRKTPPPMSEDGVHLA